MIGAAGTMTLAVMTRASLGHIGCALVAGPAVLWRWTVTSDQSSAADSNLQVDDDIDEAALASVMRTVPLGAGVLAGSAVALLVLGYLLIYILVFLPRGTVG